MTTLQDLVANTLGIPTDAVVPSLSRTNEPAWDSFNHLMLIAEIEKKFSIRFSIEEPEHIQTFGDLETLISLKRSQS